MIDTAIWLFWLLTGVALTLLVTHKQHRNCPHGLIIEGIDMPQVNELGTFNAVVRVVNAHGNVIPGAALPTDLAVADTESPALGSATVDASGAVVFTAGTVDGDGSLVATGGGFTSAPYAFSVVPDATPASLVIQDA